MNETQKEQDFAACAHIQVERFTVEKSGKVFEEQWRCADCGTKFVTLDSLVCWSSEDSDYGADEDAAG